MFLLGLYRAGFPGFRFAGICKPSTQVTGFECLTVRSSQQARVLARRLFVRQLLMLTIQSSSPELPGTAGMKPHEGTDLNVLLPHLRLGLVDLVKQAIRRTTRVRTRLHLGRHQSWKVTGGSGFRLTENEKISGLE
jgi:hypothetical protein